MARFILVALLISADAARAADPAAPLRIGPYVVDILSTQGKGAHQTLRIRRDGKLVEHIVDDRVEVYGGELTDVENGEGGNVIPRPGDDIGGLGQRMLAVTGYSGGAHCCFTVTVLVLGDTGVMRLAPIVGENYPVRFRQLDSAPDLEVVVNDNTFAYWNASFAESPAPEVVLKLDPAAKRYRPSPALMRRPAPSEAALQALVTRIRAEEAWKDPIDVPPLLWDEMLKLIYSGNAAAAQSLLARAWTREEAARDAFARNLLQCRLRTSPYWPEIAGLNGWAADPPAGCPKPKAQPPARSGRR